MEHMKSQLQGFTIVELLIVTVVIGILASVTVVAFGGVSDKAKDSQIKSTVSSIVRMVEAYGAANGGLVPQADWACVGEPTDFPAENGYTAEWCHQPYQAPPIPTGSDHPINATTNGKFKTLVTRMPNGRLPEVDRGGGVKYRGVLYDSAATQNSGKPVLQYFVNGNRTECPVGIVASAGTTNTMCEYRFANVTSETGN